jgi:hypothetical protein
MKKKILAVLPDLPQKSYLKPIADSLAFLNESYHIDYVDPCDISHTAGEIFYQDCRTWLEERMMDYHAFFGFSFGGVILQQCFSLFERVQKPIILFSVPSFADAALQEKLSKVITLCEEKRVNEALVSLYEYVFYPRSSQTSFIIDNPEEAAKRMVFGLQQVLATDARPLLHETNVSYLHLIGEQSALVNGENVRMGKAGRLIQVPQAGMRVLQDNLDYCKQLILDVFTEVA